MRDFNNWPKATSTRSFSFALFLICAGTFSLSLLPRRFRLCVNGSLDSKRCWACRYYEPSECVDVSMIWASLVPNREREHGGCASARPSKRVRCTPSVSSKNKQNKVDMRHWPPTPEYRLAAVSTPSPAHLRARLRGDSNVLCVVFANVMVQCWMGGI